MPTRKQQAASVTWEQLCECIAAGDASRVRSTLEIYSSTQLRHLLKNLAKYRRELQQLERTDPQASTAQEVPLLTAAVMCAGTPVQAASWLSIRRLVWGLRGQFDATVELLTSRRDREWIADLASRLAEKLPADPDFTAWRLVDELARHAEAPIPATPAYIRGWIQMAGRQQNPRRVESGPNMLVTWLQEQPRARDYLLAVFETDGVGAELMPPARSETAREDGWAYALGVLIAEGRVGRGELLDACAARLIRGDRPGSLRGFLALFEELAPTGTEVRERLGSYLSMAESGPAMVAKVALRELRALDTSEAFAPADLAELTESVLFRPEAGLAGEQLAWLDAALRRDRGTTALLLPTLGTAFAHPAPSVQQKAIKLLAKHIDRADPAVLGTLRAAAASLDPALRADAGQLLAAGAACVALSDPASWESPSPAAVRPAQLRPSPLPPMPQTPQELVTAFAASFTQGELSALEVEQIMAATVIATYRDRGALAAAFRPLADRHANDPFRALELWQLQSFPTALRCLFHAVLGEDFRIGRRIRIDPKKPLDPSATTVTLLRIQELTDALLIEQVVPVLLATPTESNGAVDPAVFDERMKLYASEGIDPLPFDLEHARIRTSPEQSRRTADDERALAAVFASGALSGLTMEALGKTRIGAVTSPRSKLWELAGREPSVHAVLYPQLAWDSRVRWPLLDLMHPVHESHRWPTLLPHDPDQVAAHALGLLFEQARGGNRERASVFPQLAETAGRPGPVTHLALCYGLAAERAENRVAAQDALLTFSARGLLSPGWLGEFGAELWHRNMIRGSRLLESLGQAEQAGMPADVFGVSAALIRGMAQRPDTRGLPDLLLLATRCAVGTGIRGIEIDGLDGLAALSKPKRVAAEAKRLQDAIAPARR